MEATTKHGGEGDTEASKEPSESVSKSLTGLSHPQKINLENRIKAKKSHDVLSHLGAKLEMVKISLLSFSFILFAAFLASL